MADSRQLDCGASTTSGARGRGGDPSLMTVSSEQTRVAAPAPSSKSKPGSYRSPFRPVAIDEDPDASTDEGDRVRNYQVHPGTNRFFLGGRFLTSGEPLYPLLGSSTVAVLLPALFWVFNSAWLWDRFGDGGGKAVVFILLALVLVMWASMARTAFSDPGIVPRDRDPDPPQRYVEPESDSPFEGAGHWVVDFKYIEVPGKGYVASKWCETCHTYRPPRTSHCRLCDNCVERTDHHCAFLNNCIGRRNYRPFIVFLSSAVLSALYAIAFTLYHIIDATTGPNAVGWRWDTIGAIVVALLALVVATPLAGLLIYHIRLMWSNRTTIELLRPVALRGGLVDPSTGVPLEPAEGGSSNPWRKSNPLLNMKDALGAPRRGSKAAREGSIDWRGWSDMPPRREQGADDDDRGPVAGRAETGGS
ncbi:Eukaryotic peptide chain release factor GTP-binding subunit [Rhodotorula sphaerocarpa]